MRGPKSEFKGESKKNGEPTHLRPGNEIKFQDEIPGDQSHALYITTVL